MNQKRWPQVIGAITIAAGLLIVATASARATGAWQGDAAAPSPPSFPVKLGIVVPLSGPVQSFGERVRDGALVAIEQAEAAGWTIETVYGDSQCNSQQAATVTNDLIFNQGVDYIIGAVCSSASIAISEIAEANNIVQICPASTHPRVTVNPDGTGKDYVFRVPFFDSFQGKVMATVTLDQDAQEAAVLYNEDNTYLVTLADHFKAYYEETGGIVPVFASYTKDQTDFSELLTDVADAEVDALFLSGLASEVNAIATQADTIGLETMLLGPDTWDSPDLQLDVLEGSYFCTHFWPGDDRQVVMDFVEAYSSTHATKADILAAVGYDAAGILLQSIAKAGDEDSKSVRDAMADVDYEGVTGDIEFNEFGDPLKGAAVVKIEGGDTQFIGSVSPVSGLTATSSSPTGLGHSTVFTATVATGYGVTYAWSFGDGTAADGQVVSHTYESPGTHAAVVTATNKTNSLGTQCLTTVFSSRVYLPLVLRKH